MSSVRNPAKSVARGRQKLDHSMMANATGYRLRSFAESLREKIDATLAVDKLNLAIRGELITRIQLESIRIALAKVLPDLKALEVQFTDNTIVSRHDIDAMLLASGLKPDTSWDDIEGEAVRLHTIKETDDSKAKTLPTIED